jgi:hypothetical protein
MLSLFQLVNQVVSLNKIQNHPELPAETLRKDIKVPELPLNDLALKKSERSKEQFTRATIQRLTGKEFHKTRALSWLTNPKTGRRLELDMFNETLKLAVEYDGIVHNKFIQGVHKSIEKFQDLQERDALKTALCRRHGIKLIRVPWYLSEEEIEAYLINELRK